jgi:two-component system OmpR family response regulator/two-component system response regulator QseB
MRILLAEDDSLLGDALQTGLSQRGFDAVWVKDGVAAELALHTGAFVAIVLDLGLPRLDGVELLRRERVRGNKLPVLVLTARDAVEGARSFSLGADDYVRKLVDLDELAARLRALVRRSQGEATQTLENGELSLDPVARVVTFRGMAVELNEKEFDLLRELLLNAGRVLLREQINQRLCAIGEEPKSDAVEVNIHQLRLKLAPELIRTVRGVGYMLLRER